MDTIKSIGIYCKQKPQISQEVLQELVDWLRQRNYRVFMPADTAVIIQESPCGSNADIPAKSDLLIVLGGDGTLLSVARLTENHGVPILAVNLGSLGFLTEVALPELYATLENVLKGKSAIENRMLLRTQLKRNGETLRTDVSLNDVVIDKRDARIVNLEVHVNDQYMTSYRADGLIIATPTGSTAYSLSAGGPIIHPSMNALLLCPICPFTLTNRPIVIPDQAMIQVRLITEEKVQITLDGQLGYEMTHEETLEVQRGPNPVHLIQAPGKNYYQILRQKLHWGRPAEDRKT
ncbi:NAD(+)/NADH kinase [Nitrospina watsonii]|uniref:NAD kinase n=1 Tax=Nitrospina watsonii TaxID=1323948 RepID=A0ABN8VWX5_9BACT|nr:NAD(+)/NADH kinase [Nitrospina watsonii]CAI2717344.1 NAD kinase [Nitrospina watsonii]